MFVKLGAFMTPLRCHFTSRFIQNILNVDDSYQTEVILPGQKDRIVRLEGATLMDSNGDKSGAVIVISDMTRMRRLEDVRRDFVANVSHELRTPITSIKGFAETLLEGAFKKPEEAKRFLQIIAKHADRLNAIVEDLLTLSSLEESSQKRKITFENSFRTNDFGLEKGRGRTQHVQVSLCARNVLLSCHSFN